MFATCRPPYVRDSHPWAKSGVNTVIVSSILPLARVLEFRVRLGATIVATVTDEVGDGLRWFGVVDLVGNVSDESDDHFLQSLK